MGADPLDGNPLKTKRPGGRILAQRKASGVLPEGIGNEGAGVHALLAQLRARPTCDAESYHLSMITGVFSPRRGSLHAAHGNAVGMVRYKR